MLTDLQAILKAAEQERLAAEQREAGARAALAAADADLAASTARRAELAATLGEATATAEATSARLGEVRGQLADAQREVERLADAAAAGSDPATRALAKANDSVSSLDHLAKAHQRRASAAAEALATVEQALAEHDAAAAAKAGHDLEELLLGRAEHTDMLLAAVAANMVIMAGTIARRRELRPIEWWAPALVTLADCSHAVRDALTHHLAGASPEARAALANTLGSAALKPVRGAAWHSVDCWRTSANFPRNPTPQAA